MRIRILAVAIVTLSANAWAGNWASYTNTDAVSQIVVSGDHVWGATSGGVEALNYNTGEIIKLTNTDGLKGINARCAEVDTSGALWFGTVDGWLSKVSPTGAVTNYAFRDSSGLTARAISLFNLKLDEDTIIWVASDIGISKFLPYKNNGDIKENARQLGTLPRDQDVVCVDVIGPNLWVGTSLGIAFINKDNDNIQNPAFWRAFRSNNNGLQNADIRAIASYYDTVMIGTTSGVFKLQTSPDTLWTQIGLLNETVRSLYMAGSTLLATTNSGIFQYDGANWTGYIDTGLPNRLANDLALDSRGVLWAATPNSGLGELSGSQWVLHSIPGPASNIIGRIAIDSAGGVWMTHDGKGLSRFADGQWRIYNTLNSDPDGAGPLRGLLDNTEVTLSVAPDGHIWAGSFGGGLYEYDWNSWAHWDTSNSPMFGTGTGGWYWAATSVLADPSGNIWVTSFEANPPLLMGVFAPYSQDSTWQLYFADSLGISSNSTIILRSQDSVIWVGGNTGLNRLNHNGTPFNLSDDHWVKNICSQIVSDMALDPAGTMWLATGTGLFYTDLSIDTVLNVVLPPAISGSVNSVASDGAGTIWVGTVAGLGLLKPNRSEPERSIWQAIYTSSNSPLLGDNIGNIAVDVPTGTVYIGTNNGLSVFDSGILPPRPDLADMVAFPNPAAAGDMIAFKRVPSSGTLSIYTAAGDLVKQLDLSTESTWNLTNSKGESVAGGIYFFFVRSGDASGTGKIAIIK